MLRIYHFIIQLLRKLAPFTQKVRKYDSDLARQMSRASASIALNVAEGMDAEAGTRRQRYLTALGSCNEVIAAVEIADALGYLVLSEEVRDDLQKARATLLNLVRRKA